MRTIVSIFSLLLFLWRASSQPTTNGNFLQCLRKNTDPFDDISHIVHANANNSAYTSVLQARIQNLRFTSPKTRKPEFIITPFKKPHVSAAIICTKNSGFSLRIRSGGHDFEGLSYISDTPFIILDLFNLSAISVDIVAQTAYVEAGATLGELYYRIWEKSKVHGFPAGVCPTVGIGGHISGGGYGNMIRKYGLSVDHVVDAEIVDSHGRVLNRKSMGEDLFWAIRGGGGASFGVVLSYTLGLVSVPEKVSVFRVMRFEEDNVTDIVYKWQNVIQKIDDDLFIRLLLQPVNTPKSEDQKVIRVTFMSLFLGGADRLISVMNSEFPELGLKRSDCIEMGWGDSVLFWYNYDNKTSMEVLLNRTYDADYLKRKSDYVTQPISKDGLELLWKKLVEIGKPGLVFNSYGGQMSKISESSTPFPHRDGNLYKIQYSISWKEPGEEAERKYLGMIRDLYDFMTPYVSKSPRGAYLNYRDIDIGVTHNFTYEEGKAYGEKYFKGNFDRLVKVKTNVDAENFFRNEQSIPPLKSAGERLKVVYIVYFLNAFATLLTCAKWSS